MKHLLVGWFSFEDCGATAGDLIVLDVVCQWLKQAGHAYDIAILPSLGQGVDWKSVDPKHYSNMIFLCGPFERRPFELEVLHWFKGGRIIGLDLSMPIPLDEWNPFTHLIERNSSRTVNPDFSFVSEQASVPVVGICLVEPYPAGRTQEAELAIEELLRAREVVSIRIDTRLPNNETGFRTPEQIESIIARMDMIITTRLHGLVLALKNGLPVIAIDPEIGGAKIRLQAEAIGWPLVFTVDRLEQTELVKAFDYCLTTEASLEAEQCGRRARQKVMELKQAFLKLIQEEADSS